MRKESFFKSAYKEFKKNGMPDKSYFLSDEDTLKDLAVVINSTTLLHHESTEFKTVCGYPIKEFFTWCRFHIKSR